MTTTSRRTVAVPADELVRILQLAETGANGIMSGDARSAALARIRGVEALLVAETEGCRD